MGVLKGTSQVMLNSAVGKKIILRWGIRQGDPISPYLFILTMDFLPQWMQILAQQNIIQRPFENCQQCLLYADDTLFILKPDIQQIRVLKLILDIYGQLSGMRMNLQKSELLITCTDISLVQQLAEEIGCKLSNRFSLSISRHAACWISLLHRLVRFRGLGWFWDILF
jgi:Reverse transcriptase (RNA-dependent DNA polymerase)